MSFFYSVSLTTPSPCEFFTEQRYRTKPLESKNTKKNLTTGLKFFSEINRAELGICSGISSLVQFQGSLTPPS
jgi:hypothetical protein